MQGATADNLRNIRINNEEWYAYVYLSLEGDTLIYEVDSQSGGNYDVYIMSDSEYWHYAYDEDFKPEKTHLNVNFIKGEYSPEDDQDYYLVVDNRDNVKDDDTKSNGEITVNIVINLETFTEEDLLWFYGCGAIIVIVVVAFFILRKKKKLPNQLTFRTPYCNK